jgi:tetratricopeptide (TPR) repeat protein
MFELEYRTNSFEDKIKSEIDRIRELAPNLLGDILPRYEICLAYHLSQNPDPEKFIRERYDLYAERSDTDALSAYKTGHVYFTLAQLKDSITEEKLKEYEEKALEFFEKACVLNPESYEYAAYHMTALYNLNRQKEIQDLGKVITQRFSKAPRFSFEKDPHYFYGIAVSLSDAEKGRKIIGERSKSKDADAWIHLEIAMDNVQKNLPDNQLSQVLGEFIRRVEEKEIIGAGYNTKALASAYYKLAHYQFKQGLAEEALSTYRKLTALSPHYAEIHYNQGIIFKSLAEKEKDPEKKLSLINRAKKEFDLQTQYNWGGTSAETARKALSGLKGSE